MDSSQNSILTIDELSAYLKISKSTLYKLVRENKIPAKKIGRNWRFQKHAIDNWFRDLPSEAESQNPTQQKDAPASGSDR